MLFKLSSFLLRAFWLDLLASSSDRITAVLTDFSTTAKSQVIEHLECSLRVELHQFLYSILFFRLLWLFALQ